MKHQAKISGNISCPKCGFMLVFAASGYFECASCEKIFTVPTVEIEEIVEETNQDKIYREMKKGSDALMNKKIIKKPPLVLREGDMFRVTIEKVDSGTDADIFCIERGACEYLAKTRLVGQMPNEIEYPSIIIDNRLLLEAKYDPRS